MRRSPMEIAAETAAICVSPPITEIKWALACRGGFGSISPMKRSRRSLMFVVVFSVLFTYVTQPQKKKRDQLFVSAEVCEASLGIFSVLIRCEVLRHYFYRIPREEAAGHLTLYEVLR